VRALIQGAVDQVNSGLAKHETIRKIAILQAEFTVESGELTPSLKLKRRVVEKRYAQILESFYEGAVKEL
jgi:long-chain acyl-CoA synthetase